MSNQDPIVIGTTAELKQFSNNLFDKAKGHGLSASSQVFLNLVCQSLGERNIQAMSKRLPKGNIERKGVSGKRTGPEHQTQGGISSDEEYVVHPVFVTGDADSIYRAYSLLFSGAGMNEVYVDKALALLSAVLPILVESRDDHSGEHPAFPLTPDSILDNISLSVFISIAGASSGGRFSEQSCERVRGYLDSLPGFNPSLGPLDQPEEVSRQFGFAESFLRRATDLMANFTVSHEEECQEAMEEASALLRGGELCWYKHENKSDDVTLTLVTPDVLPPIYYLDWGNVSVVGMNEVGRSQLMHDIERILPKEDSAAVFNVMGLVACVLPALEALKESGEPITTGQLIGAMSVKGLINLSVSEKVPASIAERISGYLKSIPGYHEGAKPERQPIQVEQALAEQVRLLQNAIMLLSAKVA